jgi:hypothetical protein
MKNACEQTLLTRRWNTMRKAATNPQQKMQAKQNQQVTDTKGYGDKKLNGPNRPAT